MTTSEQNVRCLACVLILGLVFVVLFSILAPLSYGGNCNFFSVLSLPGFSANLYESLRLAQNPYNVSTFANSRTFSVARFLQSRGRLIQGWIKAFYPICTMQTSLRACLALLMHCFLFLGGKMGKFLSVIALPVGGHAPPSLQF